MLWQAFTSDTPVVLLIDEVDKADIEFPNDLLRELDRMEFYVYETRELVKARHRPIVFITSNNEKELPDAFLRRCFFHYIRFPDKETMEKIVSVHFPDLKKSLLREAMEVFFEVREVPGLKKKPSTSELLDWLKLLLAEDIPPEALRSKDRKTIIPPLHGALLKNEQDVHLFERLVFMTRAKGPEVTLTFDNGPEPGVTEQVLEVLKQAKVAATFFVLGSKLADPARRRLAEQAHAEGHWIGNHTMTHQRPLGTLAEPGVARTEILDTEALIGAARASGPPVSPFRPRRRARSAFAEPGSARSADRRKDDLCPLECDTARLGGPRRLGRGGARAVPRPPAHAARAARPPDGRDAPPRRLHRQRPPARRHLPPGLPRPSACRSGAARWSPRSSPTSAPDLWTYNRSAHGLSQQPDRTQAQAAAALVRCAFPHPRPEGEVPVRRRSRRTRPSTRRKMCSSTATCSSASSAAWWCSRRRTAIDHSAAADLLADHPGSYVGVALAPVNADITELKKLHGQGFRGVRFNFVQHLGGAPALSDVMKLATKLAVLGWHLQLYVEPSMILKMTPELKLSPVPVVIDHMGKVDASRGLDQPDSRTCSSSWRTSASGSR